MALSCNKVRQSIKNRVSIRVMVFNTTLNNISVILWQSVLLMEESGLPGEKQHVIDNFIT